ncbi:leucine-rich repeat protein [Butyrivibrio sp. NC2002]|uniref:leucine-rich repeat protein n=1 Tax=Butyrivibrio sp. NC2002 TaxID=1410610 RepID=UPI00068A9EB5|nr:leucine-rich repeat protein [Butyrivibrio sp. NC2002]
MKKLTKGRSLSGALATALTVANMGALMPMTAYAADPQPSTLPAAFDLDNAVWDISFTDKDPSASSEFYDKDEANKTVTFTIKDDIQADTNGVWTIKIKNGATLLDSTATATLPSSGCDGSTGNELGGKLKFNALTTPGETTTFAVEYDQDGTGTGYTPIEVDSKSYIFKTKADGEALKGVVTLTGSPSTYTGQAVDLGLEIGTPAEGYYIDSSTTYIVDKAVGNTVTATLSGDYTTAEAYGADKKVSVTPSTSGTAKIGVWAASKGTDIQALDIKEIEVVKADITGLTLTGTGENIGINDANVTNTGISLSASETYNHPNGGAQIKWAIVKDYGKTTAATGTAKFTIKVNGGNDATTKATKAPFTGTGFTDTAVIGAGAGLATADVGEYTVIAYTGGEANTATTFANPVATKKFTVVDAPALKIKDADNKTTGSFYVGQWAELGLYAGTKEKRTSNETFTLDDATDAEFVTISGNVVTVNKVKTTSGGTVKINASYEIVDGVSDKTSAGEQYTLTTVADGLTVALGKKAVAGKDLNAAGHLEIGKTTTVVAKFAGKEVGSADGLEWSVDDEKIATIDNDGNIKAVGAGAAVFTAKYTDKKGVVYPSTPTTLTITVDAITYDVIDEDGESFGTTTPTTNILIGDSKTFTLVTSNGSEIENLTWSSDDKNITVDNGTITVQSGAKAGDVAHVKALVNGTAVATITVNAKDVIWSVVDENGDTVTAPSIFNGETITLTALRNGEPVDGEWKLDTGKTNASISISGNVLKATTAPASDDSDNGIVFFASTNKTTTPDISAINVEVKANVYEFYIDDTLAAPTTATTWAGKNYAHTIGNMEVGESHTIKFMFGSEDITTKGTTYTYDEEVFNIENGVLTVIGEGSGATIEVENKTGTTVNAKGTFTVTTIYAGKGAAQKAETAINEADNAESSAKDAIDKAAKAAEAAEATKKDPTAENLTKAQDALEDAQKDLKTAEASLEAAQKAYEEAVAAGAKSDAAKLAVDAAEERVEEAKALVETAKEDVAAAEATFKEAATEVEKAKKAEEEKKAEEQKAADQKEGATGTDATANANFTVTSTADKTVAYTAPATKAKKVTIPSTVTIDGEKFTVTEIAANAFKNDKTVTTITIPASIKKINSNAFKNAKNLKKINVKGAKLETVKKNAFNGIKKNATIKVTGANKKANKKLLKKTTAVKKGNVKVK